MEVSAEILKETDVLLAAFLTGILLLLVYDFLRVLRRIIPHKMWVVGTEDLIFWVGSAAALFAMLYRENSGYIRGFVIGGVLVGMFFYNLIFSASEKAFGTCKEKNEKSLSVYQKTIEKILESS